MLTIDTLMKKQLVTADPAESVDRVARRMSEAGVGAAIVILGERVSGIFTERDLLDRVVARGLDPKKTEVADVATADVHTVATDASLRECAEKLKTNQVRHLPVMNGIHPVGIISARDFFLVATRELERLVEHLRYDEQLREDEDPYDHLGGSYGR